jgi:hypothetical protein
MSRVLAVLVAIGMVAGALYVRGRIDDDGNESGGGGALDRLVCDTTMAAACEGAADELVLEDATTTAGRLLAPDARAPDAWLTPGPWPEMVDALRGADGLPLLFDEDAGDVLASTRLAVVAPPDTPTDWRELGTQVGAADLRLGWRDPASGLGVLQVGAFAVGWFDGPDFAANDLDLDPGFGPYLDAIVDRAEVHRSPLLTRLQTGAAQIDAALVPEEEAVALLGEAAASRRDDLRPLYPEPVVVVEALLVGDDDVAEDLRTALEDEGWAEPATTTNLPAPGVLAALWEDVRR